MVFLSEKTVMVDFRLLSCDNCVSVNLLCFCFVTVFILMYVYFHFFFKYILLCLSVYCLSAWNCFFLHLICVSKCLQKYCRDENLKKKSYKSLCRDSRPDLLGYLVFLILKIILFSYNFIYIFPILLGCIPKIRRWKLLKYFQLTFHPTKTRWRDRFFQKT